MNRYLVANCALALSVFALTNSAPGAGPFGIFQTRDCCDEACCDAPPSQSTACHARCSDCDGDPSCTSCEKCSSCDRSCMLGDLMSRLSCNPCPDGCSYISLFGGWSDISPYSGEIINPPPLDDLQGYFDDGWAIGVAHGRRFNGRFRGEVEFAYRNHEAGDWSRAGAFNRWSGDLNTYTGTANLYWDWINCFDLGLNPYLGGGIGFAIVDGDFASPLGPVEIEDEAFVYQAMVGLTRRISRRTDLFVEYRYLGATEVTLRTTAPPPDLEGDFAADFDNVFFGLRFWR